MNGNCLDIGTIQAFLDGETRPEEAVKISEHVADCDPCTILLAQAEEENSMVFSVLDREMNSLVPTQRLWNRINESIAEEKSRATFWQRLLAFVSASFANPSFAAAAGILLVVGIVGVVFLNQRTSSPEEVAATALPMSEPAQNASEQQGPTEIIPIAANDEDGVAKGSKVERSNLSDTELKRIIPTVVTERGPKKPNVIQAQYLPGEESYIKTIGELEQGVTAQNASVKASSQVAYQRDLAVVDDSIKKMREVVRKNPRNQAAKQVLYSSYQDKIDLLKSSAQRDELMASLQ